MKYKENDKVTIQSQEWYEQNKQPNGFIIFKDANKISTFSPGMVKFCDQTFTVGKVITGSSIYPDHYTFVEDGGAYKWTDEMIAGPAGADAPTYTREAAPTVAPAPKPVEKPAPKAEPKPAPKPVEKPAEQPKQSPKPVEKPAEQPKPDPKPVERPKPVEQPKPAPKPVEKPADKPVEKPETTTQEPAPKPVQAPQQPQSADESAFESFTILLKPRQGASLSDCTVQAFKIMTVNESFPSAAFEFNGFEISITRK